MSLSMLVKKSIRLFNVIGMDWTGHEDTIYNSIDKAVEALSIFVKLTIAVVIILGAVLYSELPVPRELVMEGSCVKIVDLLKDSEAKTNFSIEVSPGLDLREVCALEKNPLFYSVTWHAKTHMCRDLDIPSIKLAEDLSKKGLCVLIHISCDYLRRKYLDDLLSKLKDIKIVNIFAVQGDSFDSSTSDFEFAKDLVTYIRQESRDSFCIGVAGYPGCDDIMLQHLKSKVDCGADFIVTQASFDAQDYLRFGTRCKNIGINVPIVPGIFLFESINQLRGFAKLCNVRITGELSKYMNSDLEFIKKDDVMKLLKEITMANNRSCHFFSHNRVKAVLEFVEFLKS